ncbi:MAG TPA: EF-P lysine aminoacylase EpmA, partial [Woeseiaceae bacterium]|nr:EF-P lysine aminoacylase EpmA [Woeseiaceae bacterium]
MNVTAEGLRLSDKSRSMNWRPTSGVAVAMQRAELIARARDYFTLHKVLSVDTPAFGSASVTDPHIASFKVAASSYLQTSPEYYMKRLLAAGYPDIYSICRVFRAEERGRRHLPEFTLIEWYRRNFLLDDIVADTCNLLAHMLDRHLGAVQILDYQEAFRQHAGLDPFHCTLDDLADRVAADAALRSSLGDDRDAWLDLVLSFVVVPRFDKQCLTVLQHYPCSQAALARRCPANPELADRFEVFFGDLELANGYVELGDRTEQAERMNADIQRRTNLGLPAVPVDRNLLAALDAGLPNC